jgi:hypothetical protein
MIGLPPFDSKLTSYRDCLDTIGGAVKHYTVSELEELNAKHNQAGVESMTWDRFQRTQHGKSLCLLPPFTVKSLETSTPPVVFLTLEPQQGPRQPLEGVKVLELCRVIAGPTIGRSLAALGASVLKVTSPRLPDVPFFQLDVNAGKHTTALDLHDPADRAVFNTLLAEADVVIDGYRPGALGRLGYGANRLAALASKRGRGYVYVAEDCFGGTMDSSSDDDGSASLLKSSFPWSDRRGWQQIADCVTGVAWEQGRFMGLDEPVVPPFPMSDYGTGALGAAAALAGLYNRATKGGSWACRSSLCQYDIFLMSLGSYPSSVQERIRLAHSTPVADKKDDFFALRHDDSVDEVGRRALLSMRRVAPHLFADAMMQASWSDGYAGQLCRPKDPVTIKGLKIGYLRSSRPNGFDAPGWDGWETHE